MALTYRQKRALQAFRPFAREFPLEQAVNCPRRSVNMPEADGLDPELAEKMADLAAELHVAGELADDTYDSRSLGIRTLMYVPR